MAGQATPRALLLDCLGTLLRLEPPGPRLQVALRARAGVDVPAARADAAMRAEIAFYRAHFHEATDRPGLERLRERCAVVVRDAVPGLEAVPLREVRDALLDALVFTPFDDVVPALRALRRAGLRLVVVSNWDVSLHEALARTGLRPLLDGAVSSAEAGAPKPDPAPVLRGLELAGVPAGEAWLVGDSPDVDVGAARAAGVRPVLVDRAGSAAAPGVAAVGSLGDLQRLLG